ncbi:MAG: hypothetical protein IID15_09305, partial [Candidatus Marinimicrobia bacterium]|nr:hypothetical protein [Candidatus Neomarinimicrobiota bacterium]
MYRLKTLLLAVGQMRGSALRQTIFLAVAPILWISGLALSSIPLLNPWILGAALGPVLTLGGYIAGMMWPVWRVNWIVRVGVLATAATALWLWLVTPPMTALVLTWMPLIVGLSVLGYHERKS